MDNSSETTVLAASQSPPDVTGVAIDSAAEFFKDVKAHGFPTQNGRKHGIWFLYTVNGVVKIGEVQSATLEALPQGLDAAGLAEQGLAACDAAKLQMQAVGEGGTAQAVDILAIIRIIQFVIQILNQFPFFGGGNTGNGGTVI